MKRMKDDDNGGAQTIVIWKYFLHVINFIYADTLYDHDYVVW